ncbi:MAG: sigma-54-dependent Fis family transcriptional regulator [Desulfobulbaceae bacterium]|uniref:Sigma-54-dependent Fis family transcriptional regulator n=1 Tax=Candidatus Desulfobia pelagia TaxID=2841692 RepID=A0A8J6NF42_9BACT|nr:sigma-54-dependent Fis family transcriptional regulator [Candidatus Desulfobia pelagia]
MKKHRILVVDDEKLVCWSLSEMLTEAGFEVETALTGADARALFESFQPEMVLLDVRLPDANGIELLSEFKSQDEDVVVVMITAYADADSAVNALKIGADDYIGKPFDLDNIKHVVNKSFEKKKLRNEVDHFRRELRKKYDYDNLIGNSPQIIDVFKMIKVCAQTDAKIVLVLGESGTGKQLVARAIHYHSARTDAPFIETNCAAIPENLLENELFGHEKGAFTDASRKHKGMFESAEGGSVFLDEIGDMPLAMQAKVLKIIDSNKFRRLGGDKDLDTDVRLITATNQDLQQMVKEKKFRGDLFYRLNVMTIQIPPLRDRKDDIPSLVNYFIERLNEEYGRSVEGISPEALDCLAAYDWPGNVRELRNAVERAMMLEEGRMLSSQLFKQQLAIAGNGAPSAVHQPVSTQGAGAGDGYITLPPDGISLEDVETQLIRQAMERFDGNQTQAAKCLHMSRDTLRYRIKKFELQDIGK